MILVDMWMVLLGKKMADDIFIADCQMIRHISHEDIETSIDLYC